MSKQGEYVGIEFSSADASTAAAVTLKDANGVTRTLASNERLLIDTLTANVAAGVTVDLFSDNDADGAVDAGERMAVLGAGGSTVEFGCEGMAAKVGITPKVLASGAGAVAISGVGRIVKDGSSLGVTRPVWRESLV